MRLKVPLKKIILVIFAISWLAAGSDNLSKEETGNHLQVGGWKRYRSERFQCEFDVPRTWQAKEEEDFIGLRDPRWNLDPVIEGYTVTVKVILGHAPDSLIECGFQTRVQAVESGDEPLGGFGDADYFTVGSSEGPAVPAQDTAIGTLRMISAEISTRLYGGPERAYLGASSGKQVMILGNGRSACIRVETPPDEKFARIVSSFRLMD